MNGQPRRVNSSAGSSRGSMHSSPCVVRESAWRCSGRRAVERESDYDRVTTAQRWSSLSAPDRLEPLAIGVTDWSVNVAKYFLRRCVASKADVHEAFRSPGYAVIRWQSLRKTWKAA
jgi:hypothetical protein